VPYAGEHRSAEEGDADDDQRCSDAAHDLDYSAGIRGINVATQKTCDEGTCRDAGPGQQDARLRICAVDFVPCLIEKPGGEVFTHRFA
jgi:hypothetical protein